MKTCVLLVVVLIGAFSLGAWAQCPPGDVNRDCRVDGRDVALLASQWLADPNAVSDVNDPNDIIDPNEPVVQAVSADLNGDAVVNLVDLSIIGKHWGQTGCPIVINELLAHSHSINPDWIELYNISSVPVDLGGWMFSDEPSDLLKYRIADGTTVEPNEYIVFYEDIDFGNPDDPGTLSSFRMSENGESLYLSSDPNSGFGEHLLLETFGASETGITFGRYRKSTGVVDFVLMSQPTPGQANAYPQVGPMVINEIMYRPAADGDAEYVELMNISDGPVTLYDYQAMLPWRFTDDSGIEFSFPTNIPVIVQPREYVLLARDVSLVRRMYNVPAGVQTFEWDSGRLSNSGEGLHLLKPGDVDDGGIRYWVDVDTIQYSDGSHGEEFDSGIDPWPTGADGLGPSLNRMFWSRYGNDPNNWQATIPTPGSTND